MRKTYPIDGTLDEYRKQREREAIRADLQDRKDALKDAIRLFDCPTCGVKRLNPCHETAWEVVCDARFRKALDSYRR